jgi:hypothetical protein
MQPANPAPNAAANAPANPAANAQQMPQLMLATRPTKQPTLPTSRGTPPQIQDAMQELSLLWSSVIEQKEAGDTA